MNSTADSEDVLRVGGFYMLLDLTLTSYLVDDCLPLHSEEGFAYEMVTIYKPG